MKTLKNLAASVVAATLLVACGDNATVTPTDDPLAGVTLPTCQTVQNPLTEYWWMARILDDHTKTQTTTNSKIYRGQYKNTSLYLVEVYFPNNPNLFGGVAYACDGQGLVRYCNDSKPTSSVTSMK